MVEYQFLGLHRKNALKERKVEECFMKKWMLILVVASLVGTALFGMEAQNNQGTEGSLATQVDEQGLAYNMSRLPKELQRIIITLSLQLEVGGTYELFNEIKSSLGVNRASLAFSPDESTILSPLDYNKARLCDVNTGKELQQFTGHTNDVLSVAFSPDGRTVLTGSRDHTARLWDV